MNEFRVAVVAHGLRVAGGRSVGINIIEALNRTRPEHSYLLVLPANSGYEDARLPRNSKIVWHKRYGGAAGRVLFDLLRLPRIVERFHPNVILALGNFGIAGASVPQAVLFHNPHLVYPRIAQLSLTLPERLINTMIKSQIRRSLSSVDIVFCQTETMASRFRAAFAYSGRIDIWSNAVSTLISESNTAISELPALQKTHGVFTLLALTRYYPHKNLELIVETFARFRKELDDVRCILTIDAHEHEGARRLLSRVAKLQLANRIVNVGSVPQSELSGYYRNADGVLMPTLLESFSGTYIEAMQFGCPILASDRDFAREICGDAAQYFNPTDPVSLLNAIRTLRFDAILRRSLVANGKRRLSTLHKTWDVLTDTAMTTIESLRKSAASRVLD